jgi:hypothetical protein
MTQFSIFPDIKKMREILNFLGSNVFSDVATQALMNLSNFVQTTWVNMIRDSNAKKGWKSSYINSVRINFTDKFNSEVLADSRESNFVEKGIKRFDMKNPDNGKGLLNSPSTKQGKNGPYQIIFFQKGIPTTQNIPAMQKTIYTKAKKLSFGSSLKDIGTEGMTDSELSRMRALNKMKEKAGKAPGTGFYEGLTRLHQKGHTAYGTFRVITKKSIGWIYPGVAPTPVYPRVAEIIPSKTKRIWLDTIESMGLDKLSKGR